MAAINEYEISYTDWVEEDGVKKSQRHVIGRMKAPNGILAIKGHLTRRFEGQQDLIDCVLDARSIGSNKRLYVGGVTFEAKKIS